VDIVRILRIVSVAEATSFLLLLVGSVLKRTAEFELGVTVFGPIHGALFVAYVGLVVLARPHLSWTLTRTALALVASTLPLAPYFVERHWLRDAPVKAAEPA
jgi:integral membrane protein